MLGCQGPAVPVPVSALHTSTGTQEQNNVSVGFDFGRVSSSSTWPHECWVLAHAQRQERARTGQGRPASSEGPGGCGPSTPGLDCSPFAVPQAMPPHHDTTLRLFPRPGTSPSLVPWRSTKPNGWHTRSHSESSAMGGVTDQRRQPQVWLYKGSFRSGPKRLQELHAGEGTRPGSALWGRE